MRVLAPSRKAAMLAAAEIGEIEANTVHGLVHAHGYRWDTDGVWTRLRPGELDPVTGRVYHGPGADARLMAGHLLVVDEAGMLDQECARAVLTVADESTARVAFIGDRRQLPAIGRGGVMDMVAAWAPVQVEMTAVHRFRHRVETAPGGPLEEVPDKAYAKLSLRMRDGKNPGKVFDQLAAAGRVVVHPAEVDALALVAISAADVATRGGSQSVAVSTNEAADQINLAVRDILITRGLVDDEDTVLGADGIRIGAGDLVQTRVNDRDLGVMNRETWTVTTIHQDGSIRLRNEANRNRFAELPEQYCRDSVQHAWAQTIHGAQGSTADHGVLLLADATDASASYVGMTRGKYSNTVHIVAANQADAKAQWVDAANRGRADLGLDHAAEAARVEATAYAQTPFAQRLAAITAKLKEPRRPLGHLDQTELTRRAGTLERQAQQIAGHLDRVRRYEPGSAVTEAQQALDERMARAQEVQAAADRVHQLRDTVSSTAQAMTSSHAALASCGRFQGTRKRELSAEVEQHRAAWETAKTQLQAAHDHALTVHGELPEQVQADAPGLLSEAAGKDRRAAITAPVLHKQLTHTERQLAETREELQLRTERPELIPPERTPAPEPAAARRADPYRDYEPAREIHRGPSIGF